MKVKYNIEKKDLGLPYWRLSISTGRERSALENTYIYIKVENYEWGFLTNEEWDKIFVHSKHGSEYSYLVSLMTKSSYEDLMTRYDEVVKEFYSNIFFIEKVLKKKFSIEEILYNSNINKLNSIKESDLFKYIYRDEKIKNILD